MVHIPGRRILYSYCGSSNGQRFLCTGTEAEIQKNPWQAHGGNSTAHGTISFGRRRNGTDGRHSKRYGNDNGTVGIPATQRRRPDQMTNLWEGAAVAALSL